MHFINAIFDYLKEVIHALGYWGVGGGMLLESACIPVPSEVVLPVGGFLVADGAATMLGVNIAAAVGSMIGSFLAYFVGKYGGRTIILKYGKYFFVSEKNFIKAEKTFNNYGSRAVFFGRLLPVIRTFISLPAGIAGMDIKKFTIYSLAGMLPWNFLLIYLGYKFNTNYDEIVTPIYRYFEYIVVGVILLIIIGIIFTQYFRKKKSQNNI